MVTVIVIMNVLISLSLLYLARQVWKGRRRLAKIADILTAAQSSTHKVLNVTPKAIYTSQQSIHNLRLGNQSKQQQIQQVRQIFSLLAIGSQIWRRNFIKLRLKSWKN